MLSDFWTRKPIVICSIICGNGFNVSDASIRRSKPPSPFRSDTQSTVPGKKFYAQLWNILCLPGANPELGPGMSTAMYGDASRASTAGPDRVEVGLGQPDDVADGDDHDWSRTVGHRS